MLKKTIKYTDFNDVEREEDFYFNLSKAELIELETSAGKDGLRARLEQIVAANDGKQIVEHFTEILQKSYGIKSEDGRRFIKSQDIWDEFRQSEAYSVLFMEIATNAEAAAAFVNGLVPKDLAAAAQADRDKPRMTAAEFKARQDAQK